MKLELEVADELGERLMRLAASDHRTVEEYAALQLHIHIYGVIPPWQRATDEDVRALRAEKGAKTPRIPLTAKQRNRIFERCEGKCAYCTGTVLYDEPWHVDHIKPLSKGGTNDEGNLTVACARCNLKKGAKLEAVK